MRPPGAQAASRGGPAFPVFQKPAVSLLALLRQRAPGHNLVVPTHTSLSPTLSTGKTPFLATLSNIPLSPGDVVRPQAAASYSAREPGRRGLARVVALDCVPRVAGCAELSASWAAVKTLAPNANAAPSVPTPHIKTL